MDKPTDKLSPLVGHRYEISGVLAVLTPLHVGTGESEEIPGVGGKEGANTTPGVARAVTDHRGDPYLPATTVKGLLRQIGEEILTPDEVDDIFGLIKNSYSASGAMGALLPRGATLNAAATVEGYPYVKAARAKGGDLAAGCFVAARAAIDPLSGVAADARLFFQEMVAPGATFDLKFVLLAGQHGETRLNNLLRILERLSAEGGVVCGRGKADGAGALQFKRNSLQVVERKIDDDGSLVEERKAVTWPETVAASEPWLGVFHCKGPFLSLDSSWNPEREKQGLSEEEQRKIPQLHYQHDADDRALQLGSQIAGVLRARARWIMGTRALAGRDDPRSVDPTMGEDERGKMAFTERVVRKRRDVDRLKLTPVERLFGVSGFAGLLRIEKMAFSDGEKIDITSVKLDHFSGAPIDNALFKTRGVRDITLTLALSLRGRKDAKSTRPDDRNAPSVAIPTPEDQELFDALKKSLVNDGLMLGHGTNKGFGWFVHEDQGRGT